uniref:Uncharacterized protein n=1 Tax=Aegilops tauschii subsp. strangulata TaxID=200361 RepID=A0A453MM98_AEGTS
MLAGWRLTGGCMIGGDADGNKISNHELQISSLSLAVPHKEGRREDLACLLWCHSFILIDFGTYVRTCDLFLFL